MVVFLFQFNSKKKPWRISDSKTGAAHSTALEVIGWVVFFFSFLTHAKACE